MARLEPTGVKLIVEGLANFNKAYAEAVKSQKGLEKSSLQLAKMVEQMSKTYARYHIELSKVAQEEAKAAQARAKASATRATSKLETQLSRERQATTKLAIEQTKLGQIEARNAGEVIKGANAQARGEMALARYNMQLQISANNLDILETKLQALPALLDFTKSLKVPDLSKLDFISKFLTGKGTAGAAQGLPGWLSGNIPAVSPSLLANLKSLVMVFAGAGSQIGQATMAMSKFAGVAGLVLAVVNGLISPVINLGKAFLQWIANVVGNLVVGAFNTLKNTIAGVIGGIKEFVGNVMQIAGGFLVRDAILGIANSIRTLAGDIVDATAELQRLMIQFEALSARDISKTMGISMADAFDLAGEAAQKLMMWVQRVAVTTPYTVDDVGRTVAMATAMGLNVGAAQKLTQATMDFASAMGLESESMYRIIYNFGQIASMGKITGREIRDLTTSFVPMHRILGEMAKDAGKTRDEFLKLALEGGVPVEQFFQEFIDMAEHDFPGAARKMARTWTGVKNNFLDFIRSVIGFETLKPVFDKLTSLAADAIEKLLSPEVRQKAHAIGEALAFAFDKVAPAIQYLSESIGSAFSNILRWMGVATDGTNTFIRTLFFLTAIATKILNAMGDWINNTMSSVAKSFAGANQRMAQWGANMVASLARGMASAVNLVIKVITFIAKAISWLLKALSPPRVLPDLDVWGENAMASYIEGWTQADFSPIGETVQNALAEQLPGAAPIGGEPPPPVGTTPGIPVKPPGAVAPKPEITPTPVTAPKPVIKPPVISFPSVKNLGANILTKFLEGFKKADFSIFNEISDLIESYLRSITDKVGEKNLIPTILGTRIAIAQSIQGIRTGMLTVSDAIKRVMGAAKHASKEFKGFISNLFLVEDAQRRFDAAAAATKAAEDALSAASKKYSNILDELNKRLNRITEVYDEQQRVKEINAAINTGLLTDEEKQRLELELQQISIKQQIRTVEDQRDAELAILEARVDAAKAAEEAAKAQLEFYQEQLDASKSLIEAQIKQNDLMKEFLDMVKQMREAAAGAAEGAAPGDELFNWDLPAQDFGIPEELDFSEMWKEANRQADEFLAGITKKWDDYWKQFDTTEASSSLRYAFEDAQKFWETEFLPALGTFSTLASSSLDEFTGSVNRLKDALGIDTNESTANGGLRSFINKTVAFPFVILAGIGATIDGLGAVIRIRQMDFDNLNTSIKGIGEGFTQFAKDVNDSAVKLIAIFDPDAPGSLPEKIGAFVDSLSKTKDDVIGPSGILTSMLDAIKNAFLVVFDASPIGALYNFISGFHDSITQTFKNVNDDLVGKSIIPEMLDAIYAAFVDRLGDGANGVLGWIKTSFVDKLVGTNGLLTNLAKDALTTATTIGQNIYDGIKNAVSGLVGWLEENVFNKIIAKLKAIWDDIRGIKEAEPPEPKTGNRQGGGTVTAHHPYMVGERGPEWFIPSGSGYIYPNRVLKQISNPLSDEAINSLSRTLTLAVSMAYRRMAASPALYPASVYNAGNNTYQTNVEVNASYAKVQSPASIMYDVHAALNAARR